MKVVLDTNIFISGIHWAPNFCSKIIELWSQSRFDLVSSLSILEELEKTFSCFKIPISQEKLKNLKTEILENSYIVSPTLFLDIVKDDPDDNKFLEAALEGAADYIVSQDKHLLKVERIGKTIILKPEEFLKLFINTDETIQI